MSKRVIEGFDPDQIPLRSAAGETVQYEAVSLIEREGRSSETGHYILISRCLQDRSTWIKIEDAKDPRSTRVPDGLRNIRAIMLHRISGTCGTCGLWCCPRFIPFVGLTLL